MLPLLQLQKLQGKGGGGCNFLADQKIAISWKKCLLGHHIAQQQVIACCQTHFDHGPPKMPLKLAV